ncbi:MAG TPA: hypothetical protein VMI72_16475 [Roseiarcus sp.]|nr:hypothetical protein [Roseiarcus sp.]
MAPFIGDRSAQHPFAPDHTGEWRTLTIGFEFRGLTIGRIGPACYASRKTGASLMHQIAASSAIRRALMRLFPDLAETPEGRSEIEHMVREIMKSFEEEGLRFISEREGE